MMFPFTNYRVFLANILCILILYLYKQDALWLGFVASFCPVPHHQPNSRNSKWSAQPIEGLFVRQSDRGGHAADLCGASLQGLHESH